MADVGQKWSEGDKRQQGVLYIHVCVCEYVFQGEPLNYAFHISVVSVVELRLHCCFVSGFKYCCFLLLLLLLLLLSFSAVLFCFFIITLSLQKDKPGRSIVTPPPPLVWAINTGL